MGELHLTMLVAGRELRETFRGKAFWIVAAIVLVASTAGMILPEVIGDDGPTHYEVAVVEGDPSLDTALRFAATAVDAKLTILHPETQQAAQVAVDEGDADAALIAGADPVIVVKADKDQRLVGVLQQVLATRSLALELRRAGLTEAQVEEALSVPAARVEQVDTGDASRRASAAILSIVLYLLLFMLMVGVANGTAIEKANRISEVLLAVVPPRALLFGKVLGVGAAGLLTTLAGAIPVIVKSAAGGDLPDGLGSALAGGAAWFLLGLVLYLTIAGALGALVERQEQAATVVAPLQVLLVFGYLVAQSASDSPVGTVLAYLPLTSPLVMPSRLAVGASSPVEMAISLSLGVLAVALSLRLGATVYRRAIVRTGRRLKLHEVLVSR